MNTMVLGDMIKARRQAKRLTQKQLGKIAGVSATLISGIESGYTKPSVDSLTAIARTLSLDLNELCGLAKPSSKVIVCDGLTDRQISALQILVDDLRKPR